MSADDGNAVSRDLLELCSTVLAREDLHETLALVLDFVLARADAATGEITHTQGERRCVAARGATPEPTAICRMSGPHDTSLELRLPAEGASANTADTAEVVLRAVAPVLAVLSELERAREASRLDALTGLLHIGAFRDVLEREVGRARRHTRDLALVLFDLDDFKEWNDQRGHLAGDRLLGAFADCLRDERRAGDWVGRCGGDEFALLLPETDLPGALRATAALRERWLAGDANTDTDADGNADANASANATARASDGHGPLPATFSAGIATCPEDGWNAEDLYATADRNLYRAKRAGRDRIAASERRPTHKLTRPRPRRRRRGEGDAIS